MTETKPPTEAAFFLVARGIESAWPMTANALLGPCAMSDLSPQSGPKRTLIKSLSPVAIYEYTRFCNGPGGNFLAGSLAFGLLDSDTTASRAHPAAQAVTPQNAQP